MWRGGEGKSEEPVLVTGWHLAPELVPQVKSNLFTFLLHLIMQQQERLYNNLIVVNN